MRLVFAALAAAGLAACASPPCTACPDVAGDWSFEVGAATGAASAGCTVYYTNGFAMDLTLHQQGSLIGSERPVFSGTLHENLHVRFSEFDFGNAEDGSPVTMTIDGRFKPDGDNWAFEGTVYAKVKAEGTCSVTAKFTGSRQ